MRTEFRIAGTGGMGVVFAGVILGHAAVVHAGLDSVQTQSYGSEARGTAAKSEVIISDEQIRYPKVREADYSVLMSQKAFEMYLSGAKKGGVLLIDPDLIDSKAAENDFEIVSVPAMKTADEMGLRLVSNMVMLGALVKKSEVFPVKALENALKDLIKSKALKLDIDAVRAGTGFV
ncbi:MAG: 2-oxoacid:acceptor oxidoreductase family protein [Candidatus Thorarchaeota archaeon]|jgi:2-oxoglutarate ferredoxin oxidoreductase subunit gamma